MKCVLVILGTAIHEEGKITFKSVDAQVYMDSSVDDMCGRLIDEGHYDSFVIPSMYKGEIILPEGVQMEPEFMDGEWEDIEREYPRYHNSDKILEHDILCRLVDKEEVDPNDATYYAQGCPKGFTVEQWYISQWGQCNTEIFMEIEA